ncbi:MULTISPECIES: energy transducer TonB [Chryseobacterium]|uniref:TonB-like protein n=1 Tax=Chryseobacterium geocarposphaerae TaxID=1416776 RepID=A0ABU1LEH8_9FLAO|nr:MULTISPECIES: hypothetical protein [Chryseobacterium]MDR6404955.1 hypothetical protein [Chryseobacterium geocarposphaerae]MDR6697738.1 hypothetical protein [Chryseobacterium ginsenosidimutans]
MKKIILFLGLFLSVSVFAQEFSSVSQLPDYAVLKAKMKLDDVVTKADTAPEFPGGMDTFKRKFAESMDVIDVKSSKINTRVYFIIEKTGYVRYVTATGDDKKHSQAAEVAVRRLFVKWKPATINGEPVRYMYTFPLALKKYN